MPSIQWSIALWTHLSGNPVLKFCIYNLELHSWGMFTYKPVKCLRLFIAMSSQLEPSSHKEIKNRARILMQVRESTLTKTRAKLICENPVRLRSVLDCLLQRVPSWNHHPTGISEPSPLGSVLSHQQHLERGTVCREKSIQSKLLWLLNTFWRHISLTC